MNYRNILLVLFCINLNFGCAAVQVPEVSEAEHRLADLHAANYGVCAQAATEEAVAALIAAQTSVINREAELARWQALASISNTREGHLSCQSAPLCPACACERQARADEQGYVVERGDCLWNIAKKPEIYNDPFLWPIICSGNNITNCNLIYPNQRLEIPDTGDFPIEQLDAVRHSAGAR